jgi:uncharacterized membrane protein
MRGLAAAVMLQGHVFDAWLRPEDRNGEWFWLSQFLGGLPAPIFLFLVGVSLALVMDKMRAQGAPASAKLSKVVRRGVWILLLAYAFRIEQYLVWYPGADWRGIFKVGTLNCIGISTLLIGLIVVPSPSRRVSAWIASGCAAVVIFATPFLYGWRVSPIALLQAYFNGDGHPGYFAVIPWIAFALCGLAFGFMLNEARQNGSEAHLFSCVAVAGVCAFAIGSAMNLSPIFRYGFFDYSLTSPHFFLVRLGYLLLILYGAYRWSLRRQGAAWSPLRTLGQASLIVYWVHIDIVYGRPAYLMGVARSATVSEIALHLFWVVPTMVMLAWASINRGKIRDYAVSLPRRIGLNPAPEES